MNINAHQEVRVFAPATVANVACGFDVLGFAINAPGDEVVARHSEKPGLRITKITGDDGKLPKIPEKKHCWCCRTRPPQTSGHERPRH